MLKRSLIALIFAPIASLATPYQITLKSYDIAATQRVKNCIDYSVCSYASATIERSYTTAGVMEIEVELDEREREQVLQGCLAPNQYELQIKMVEKGSSVALPIPLANSATAFQGPSPVDLTPLPLDQNFEAKVKIEDFLSHKKYDRALSYILSTYGISFADYAVSVNPKKQKSKDAYAITSHDDKTVVVDRGFFSSMCDIILGLRHEAEHVSQMKRVAACEGEGKTSAFKDQLYRERAAYFNDLLNLKNYCFDFSFRNEKREFVLNRVFEHYGNDAPLNYSK